MESKLNHKFIKRYSAVFAAKINDDFFAQKEVIEGKEILELTDVKQVNLFAIKALFEKWQSESKNIRSPYFDYGNKNVGSALTQLMNTLSNHILVKREHFEELLREAVEKTILLLFSPYDFYCQEINMLGPDAISTLNLKQHLKYVKINNHLMENLIEQLEAKTTPLSVNEVLEAFDEVCANIKDSPEEFESYLDLFSAVTPLSIDQIYVEKEENDITDSEDEKEIEEENVEPKEDPEIEVAKKEEPKQLNIEVAGKSLNDKFVKEKKTLNDQIKAKLDSTIADLHQNKKIESISKSININERFMFVNELFGGDKEVFQKAVNAIDNCSNQQEAQSLIKNEYAAKFNWDMEKKEVNNLLELVDRMYTEE